MSTSIGLRISQVDSDMGHLPLDLGILRYNLTRVLGDPLVVPPSYAVFDLETTGFSPRKNKIWQIGFYLVHNGVPQSGHRGLSFLLKTSKQDLLANRFEIDRVAEQRMKSFPENIDEATRKAEDYYLHRFRGDEAPVERVDGLREAAGFLEMCIHNEYPIIGHNLAAFDVPFFEAECERVGVEFKFPEANMIDTGMFIKSAELGRTVLDTEYYRPMAFYRRIKGQRRRGAYYSLGKFCFEYWRLDLKYGADMDRAHDAGYDCWVTSLVLQELIASALEKQPSDP